MRLPSGCQKSKQSNRSRPLTWSDGSPRRDSNPRPSDYESDALPLRHSGWRAAERVGVKAECIGGCRGRARVMGLPAGLAGLAEQEGAGDGEECQVVGEVVGGVGADLVEAEELVLDGAVVEVEAAGAEEDAGEGEAGWVGGGVAAFDQLDDADDEDDGAEDVEQAVGDEADGGGGAVVEVVPGEELVEDDLVEGAGEADADQDAGPEQGEAGGAASGHPITSSWSGSHAIEEGKPG